MMTTAWLVCEGACGSPWTHLFDQARRRYAELINTQPGLDLDTQLGELGRQLVHTLHVRDGRDMRCTACDTRRVW